MWAGLKEVALGTEAGVLLAPRRAGQWGAAMALEEVPVLDCVTVWLKACGKGEGWAS